VADSGQDLSFHPDLLPDIDGDHGDLTVRYFEAVISQPSQDWDVDV